MENTLAVQQNQSSFVYALIRLTKPGVTLVLVFTAVMTAWAASGPWISIDRLITLAVAGGLMASGAAALNQYLEIDIDSRMPRTAHRPLPAGQIIRPQIALAWGTLLCVLSLGLSLLTLPIEATFFIVLGLILYVPYYTLHLKRRTTWNIVLGGAAGCCPVLAGWAVARADWPVTPWALAALIFFWTPAHFWAYALIHREGYRKAGIPMLPSVIGFRSTVPYIFVHALLMVMASFLAFSGSSRIVAHVAGGLFLTYCVILWLKPTASNAWKLYRYSNYYLILIFIGLVIGRFLS